MNIKSNNRCPSTVCSQCHFSYGQAMGCCPWVQIWPKYFSLYPHPMKLDGGMYTGFILSVCLSVDNMVFRVCFGISTSNFMCMFIVAIGRKAHCFSATSVSKWPPSGHIGFFGFRTLTSLWLWISTPSFSSKILVYMGRSLLILSDSHFQNGCLAAILDFSFVYSVGGMVSGA